MPELDDSRLFWGVAKSRINQIHSRSFPFAEGSGGIGRLSWHVEDGGVPSSWLGYRIPRVLGPAAPVMLGELTTGRFIPFDNALLKNTEEPVGRPAELAQFKYVGLSVVNRGIGRLMLSNWALLDIRFDGSARVLESLGGPLELREDDPDWFLEQLEQGVSTDYLINDQNSPLPNSTADVMDRTWLNRFGLTIVTNGPSG